MQHSQSQAHGHWFHADECRVTTTDIVVCSFFLLGLVLALVLILGWELELVSVQWSVPILVRVLVLALIWASVLALALLLTLWVAQVLDICKIENLVSFER